MDAATLIATIGGGGGDISFATSAAACLVRHFALSVVVVRQSGGESGATSAAFVRALAINGISASRDLRAFASATRRADALDFDDDCDGEVLRALHASPLPRLIVQAPLRLFHDAASAIACIYASRPSLVVEPHNAHMVGKLDVMKSTRLITLREFGMQYFCNEDRLGAESIDRSSGLGCGELGIWAIQPPRLEAVDAVRSAVRGAMSKGLAGDNTALFVGYFRGATHCPMFMRLVVAAMRLRVAPVGCASSGVRDAQGGDSPAAVRVRDGSSPCNAVCCMLGGDALLRGGVIERAAMSMPCVTSARAFFDHAGASKPTDPISAVGSGVASADRWARGVAGGVELTIDVSPDIDVEGAASVAEGGNDRGAAASPDADARGRHPHTLRLLLIIVDLDMLGDGLPLPLDDFRAVLAAATAAVVTGDGTLNEALAFGTPFGYAAAGHKGGVASALAAEAARGGAAADVVACLWAVLAPLRRTAQGSACSDGQHSWSALRAAVSRYAVDTDKPCSIDAVTHADYHSLWRAVESAFRCWSSDVMSRKGHLSAELLRLADDG